MPRRIDLKGALNKLRTFYKDNDRLPSYGETAAMFGYASRNAAVGLIGRLIDHGFIKKATGGKLVTMPSFHQKVKLLGAVAAGFPTPEEEELRNTLSLDEFLIEKAQSTYMLEVKGDSMINAGIVPGDYVLVEKGRPPRLGDIVVAQVDGEWTMKYFARKNGKTCLEAANPRYQDIYPKQELVIGGVVVSSCRKYA
ncbi:MAG: LexA family transcriptional regulator [Candidatus Margulisiibacteriota bacterium]